MSFTMTYENEKLDKLLRALLLERPEYSSVKIPASIREERNLLRTLMNIRPPAPISKEILKLQNEELTIQCKEKGTVNLASIPPSPLHPHLRLWQGDITRLEIDAIVNAANAQMLGCFIPHHKCIDNAIHSAAGLELREECNRIMQVQGHEEPTGQAKITHGYNLPAHWIIHTVGPIVYGSQPTPEDCRLLADCYRNSLTLADQQQLQSIAFCCISTGEFHFPREKAAEIAVETVRKYLSEHKNSTLNTIIFNVFKKEDYSLYKQLLKYE